MNNIITLSGDPGSGKSTVREALRKTFEENGKNVKIYCVGDIFRDLAEEKGMTVTEFNQMLEKENTDVDKVLDEKVTKFGEKIIQENDPNTIYIIDSRMAWKNIPTAYKVKLTVEPRIAGERIFNDKSRGKEDQYHSIDEAIEATKARKKSEIDRYHSLYGVDISQDKNFNININTSFATPEGIAKIILENMNEPDKNKGILWASPKLFLPSQTMRNTAHTFNDVKHSIQENGYYSDSVIRARKMQDMYVIIDGRHRNFAAVSCEPNCLLPYEVEKKECTTQETQEFFASNIGKEYFKSALYDFEEAFGRDKNDMLRYTYDEAYPGIYSFLDNYHPQANNEREI